MGKRKDESGPFLPIYWVHLDGTFLQAQPWLLIPDYNISCPQPTVSCPVSITIHLLHWLLQNYDKKMQCPQVFSPILTPRSFLPLLFFYITSSYFANLTVLIYKVHWIWSQDCLTWVQALPLLCVLEQIFISKMKVILIYSFSNVYWTTSMCQAQF